ncbi:glucuronate isomerase [Alloacidobacterium dinghuense]|uniref:Uronate isomerase n=1 Tax=Alloacidobacterium dinghuense TaxID=2763107 RepID=A0A7G8BRN9_9BACT|nr:glucuronate isomerase [Alloacidobacterium dinghuense]QNI35209.1 glucuronate isomerase [Alloacidobacterium dinghuense]
MLHPDRLFPADPGTRAIARRLYASISDLPIISPHGHTEAAWFAKNDPFPDPAQLLILPDHYIYRMLYSQGVSMHELGIRQTGAPDSYKIDSRKVWRIFAEHYHLFSGTPTRIWLDYEFEILFGLDQRISAATADHYFDVIAEKLQQPEFLPRALYERFHLEALSTTDSPLDSLEHHQAIRESNWKARILPTFRPDSVVDPAFQGFRENIGKLGDQTGEDTSTWPGYLNGLRKTRQRFKSLGATATDHGHPTANTANLSPQESEKLFAATLSGNSSPEQQELFRAQMLTEMARMSIDDGLVMQLHPGSFRNHNQKVFEQFGRDSGADIPTRTDYVHGLKPLLDLFGNEPSFTFILFTLDESTFSRELAPLAGHYPCLRLGPPWWFFDSPEGMLRFRELATETAGFYNTVGFNDDTRAFLSIPARHDVARRIDCNYLARLVAEHRIDEDEAFDLAQDLTINLVRKAYRL